MASKRLIKVAKELNVGTTTIVEHLIKSGFDIENKPTAKVSDDMYNILLKDFQKSIAIKEQANQLTIGSRERKEAEAAAREKVRVAKEVERAAKEAEKLAAEKEKLALLEKRRKEEALKLAEEERKRIEQEKQEKEKRKLGGLKVVSKVEIDKKGNVVKPTIPPVPTDKKVEKEKVESVPAEVPVQDKKTPPTKKSETPKPEVKKTSSKPKVEKNSPSVKKKEEIVAPPIVESPSDDDDEFRAKTPILKGLKILGKIDTNKFKKPSRRKKTRKEEDDDRKTKDRKDGGEARGRRRRVKGTDVPVSKDGKKTESGPQRPQPVASSDDEKGPRKRKRKKIIKPTTLKVENKSTTENGDTNKTTTPTTGSRTTGTGRPPSRRDSTGTGRPVRRRGTVSRGTGRSGDAKKADVPKEVSKKEIEDKIKATMARLAGGGKNKRQKLRRDNRERIREKEAQKEQDETNNKLQVTEFISASELASVMDVSVTEVITTCLNLGVIVSINQRLDAEIIELVASEFEFEVEFISVEDQMEEEEEIIDDPADLVERAPIVTVMGHVDHGKTSLLDYIRKANVVDGEAGGITQHIGAYEMRVGEHDKKITFLDTPGHEAFTAMRARGAKVTDIAIIIIAADDHLMPQTKEAISHAQAAGVPMIFAINKVDKPGAQPERIKQELAGMNLLVEEWGGKYQSSDISAKMGTNIDDLLEKVLLEAELLELKANPSRQATGVVLEASLDKGRGFVTKLLVQNGTLNIKDPIVAGAHAGRIKAMFNEKGKRIKKVGPASPVLILGLSGAPQAGEKFKVSDSEQDAKILANKRDQINREQQQRAAKRITLDQISDRLKLGNFKELNLIVKGDVDGSIEALADSLLKQSVETVQVNVLHRAVGQITESDVLLASASDAIIIGFQVRPSPSARLLAEKEGVEIKMYSVIYDAIGEIRAAIEGLLEPTQEEKQIAEVEIREVFKISKVGTIAGCYVREGKIKRGSLLRIIRDGIVIYPKKEGVVGELASLKRFKDDVAEVKFGFECGLTIKNFNDIIAGDTIEAYEIIEVKQKLANQDKITTG